MDITYRQVGDYKIPNLDLPEEAKVLLGRWGTAHKDYLGCFLLGCSRFSVKACGRYLGMTT